MSWTRDVAYGFAGLVSAPIWGVRMLRRGKWKTDWAGKFGRVEWTGDSRRTLLIHAVSVGEINAIQMLVAKLHARHGRELRLAISVTTDTGFARATALYGEQYTVVRYPFDFTASVSRFLDAVKPAGVALVELEVWPTFVEECGKRGIPVCVINGRLSERSARGYRRFRPLIRTMFARLSAVGAQDAVYAERFVMLGAGADRVKTLGTMKWDTAVVAEDVPGSEALASAMGIDRDRPLVVCGSSGPGEEAMFVEVFGGMRDGAGRAIQLMIVPRKPERFEEAASAMGDPVRRSAHGDGASAPAGERSLFLLDTMGELRKAYALADLVVVGRSFGPQHGSDMMEPIGLGKPTVVGPNTWDFADTMAKLLAGGGIVQVSDISELAEASRGLLGTEAGRALAERGRAVLLGERGATDRYVEMIERLLGLGSNSEAA